MQLHYELDLILGKGTCGAFRQKWLDLVPRILAAARMLKQSNISQLLKEPRFENLDSDFGKQYANIHLVLMYIACNYISL